MKIKLHVLYEDNHLIVVNKRPGDIVQGDRTGDKPLSEVVERTSFQLSTVGSSGR